MTRFLFRSSGVLVLVLASAHHLASRQSGGRPELTGLFDFEADHTGGTPKGWAGFPPGTFSVDSQVVHGGRWSLRIERKDDSPQGFTAVSKMVPVDFAGTKLELRGFLRTENISGFAGLWMREDDDGGPVAFDNMERRKLKGTTEWIEYSIELPLEKAAKRLTFGVLGAGTGRVWADDLRLLVDGTPIGDVPRVEPPKTALDLDKEFDGGSGIVPKDLTATQITNLAMLGKVWGFLKYHHPLIAAGGRHWDYELFRVLPRVLSASNVPTARSAVNQWVTGIGAVPTCNPCARLVDDDVHLKPSVTWLTAEALGTELATTLRAIHQNRPAGRQQFYLSFVPGVGNPVFDHELP